RCGDSLIRRLAPVVGVLFRSPLPRLAGAGDQRQFDLALFPRLAAEVSAAKARLLGAANAPVHIGVLFCDGSRLAGCRLWIAVPGSARSLRPSVAAPHLRDLRPVDIAQCRSRFHGARTATSRPAALDWLRRLGALSAVLLPEPGLDDQAPGK